MSAGIGIIATEFIEAGLMHQGGRKFYKLQKEFFSSVGASPPPYPALSTTLRRGEEVARAPRFVDVVVGSLRKEFLAIIMD